jgi:hypothetical protein
MQKGNKKLVGYNILIAKTEGKRPPGRLNSR